MTTNFTSPQVTGDIGVTGDVNAVIEGISLTNFNVNAGITNIASATKTTILTQSFILGIFQNLAMISVSGDDYAKFFFTKNGVDIDIRRTGPDRNLTFDFTGAPYKLVLGDVVDIKVEHFNTGTPLDFDATIYGY